MVSFSILAGGLDTFIATYLFNPSNASLTLSGRFEGGTLNCSWIGRHPTNNSVFYALNELFPGSIRSFTTTPDGAIAGPFDTALSGGDNPVYLLALSTGEVGVVNYMSGTGRFVPTTSPLMFAIKTTPTITFPAPKGGMSHPHMVFEHGDEILVPDKGSDTVWRLRKSKQDEMWKLSGDIVQPFGSGPRHIAVHGDRLFTLHETASTLTLQKFPKLAFNSSTPFIANLSTIPDNPPLGSVWAAAEILMPKATKLFPKTYIYVSNRNRPADPSSLDPRGDTIAIFEHVGKGTKKEGLRLVKQVFTGLNQVRGMSIGLEENGSEKYLVTAGAAGSGGTVVFERVDGGAGLKEVARNTEIPQRNTFLWLH
ncbi:hypothetical protein D9758_000861 [Tetrapyrgos nigripes]|uniref:Isomerase YbhE n=1 Tax=Tetrapyrgos nigripes TaxID=182062 RepID=A0A8H5GZC6_9AGAR|nr:hypothetical protein D9758_000861 [Tetrapyrgos nigripes]